MMKMKKNSLHMYSSRRSQKGEVESDDDDGDKEGNSDVDEEDENGNASFYASGENDHTIDQEDFTMCFSEMLLGIFSQRCAKQRQMSKDRNRNL